MLTSALRAKFDITTTLTTSAPYVTPKEWSIMCETYVSGSMLFHGAGAQPTVTFFTD